MENAHDTQHGGMKSYIVGFVLSVILTVAAFWVVMNPGMSAAGIATTVVILAVVQILVHLGCFLHMSPRKNGEWDFVALVFTVVIVGLLVAGTIWIMVNMIYTLMPQPGTIPGL